MTIRFRLENEEFLESSREKICQNFSEAQNIRRVWPRKNDVYWAFDLPNVAKEPTQEILEKVSKWEGVLGAESIAPYVADVPKPL